MTTRIFNLWDSNLKRKIEVVATPLNGGEWKARCIRPERHKNGDEHPSLRINDEKERYYCDVCKISGALYDPDFAKAKSNNKPLLDKKPISPDLKAWLKREHKWFPTAFERFGVGEGQYKSEPCLIILLENKQKLYFWKRANKDDRWMHFPKGKGGGILAGNLDLDEIIVAEGEWDFFCLWEHGFRNIATSSTGVGTFPEEKVYILREKDVVLAYDNDNPGREGTKCMSKKLTGIAKSIRVLDWGGTELQDEEDVRDFFTKYGHSVRDFQELLGKAKEVTGDIEVTIESNEIQITDENLIPLCPFPFNVFPEKFKNIIKMVCDALGVDRETVASAMLAIVSGATGNSIKVSPKQGYEVPLFIWLIIIAPSGYGKTPLIQALMKYVIEKLQGRANRDYKEKMSKYEILLKEAKKDESLATLEKPNLTHYMVSDCTVEALADVFESTPRGVIAYQDEISGLILGLNQYKGKGNDRQHYLELFNCGSWKIDRKKGTKFIPSTGASIIGGIQPRIMPVVFGVDSFDDGMFPRFLLLNADINALRFNRQGITEETMANWIALLDWCYQIPLELDENGFVEPNVLTLGDSALNLWENFYNEYIALMPYLSERARVFIPKLIGYYSLKFAGILHTIWAFEEGKKDPPSSIIDEEKIRHAIELTRFFAGQAIKTLKLYEPSEEAPLNEFQKRLMETLFQLKDEVKNGRLALSKITDTLNSGLSGLKGLSQTLQLSPKKIGAMLKELGLRTEESTGGIYYLIWEPEKIHKIFSKHISTKSTMSTFSELARDRGVDIPNSKSTMSTNNPQDYQTKVDLVDFHNSKSTLETKDRQSKVDKVDLVDFSKDNFDDDKDPWDDYLDGEG